MSINWPVAPESMRALISIRVLLPMVWIHSGSSVPLCSVVECMRTGLGQEVDWRILGAWLSWFSAKQLVTEGLTYLL